MPPFSAVSIFAAFTILLASSCNKAQPSAAPKTEGQAAAPNVKVELPPSPNFDEAITLDKYEDGAFSIYGLRKDLDDNVKAGDAGSEVMVRGYVQEIYAPPPCPGEQKCPLPKQPHFWLTDKPGEQGKKRALMVVNYQFTISDGDRRLWRNAPDVVLEVGKQYTLKGKFRRFSDSGFADERGLLEFVAYKPLTPVVDKKTKQVLEWVYPKGAAWHPIMVEQNAKAAAKAAPR